ncbi:ribonuclease III [Sphingomonas sp. CL5.1]|uniref:ribonuclease III n=1 Tax=Sphingomonas sp. CL5.1 TaxID=2653203 RepID=UPI001581A535|nr:ribonuclease III [Sphingomonas sp. CL5.1]QKS01302.1 ribonuclease III [Sphingomonas sp. CL5.1]
MGDGGALEPDRGRILSVSDDLAGWIADTLGHRPADLADYERALTHGSRSDANYERLEFLGDRVLGLVMAEWLYERFPGEPEGALSKRYNALVTGAVCAEVARGLGVPARLRLGKQARDDGASDSDNVLGDVMEGLLGALYRDAGLEAACGAIRRLWAARITADTSAPQHPKSALQEWAAAHQRKPPVYEIVDRSGPGHAPRFTVKAMIPKLVEALAEGGSKQEAETAAARMLLEKVKSR